MNLVVLTHSGNHVGSFVWAHTLLNS